VLLDDKLFTGIAVERPAGVDEGPLGSEGIGPEDTFDGDYGRLLEQVYVKGVASPSGIEDLYVLVGSALRVA
jgi:hypothetical protein